MYSKHICVGFLVSEPKLRYAKNIKVVNFRLLVKRADNKNNYDSFRFEAWDKLAEYILGRFHTGDCLAVESRPRNLSYKKKDGTKIESMIYRVTHCSLICHRERTLINKFGYSEIEEFPDIRYFE